jgi:hypothetical protein
MTTPSHVSKVRIARRTRDRADELLAELAPRPARNLSWNRASACRNAVNFADSVRSDAYYAWLNGARSRAKALNRLADKLSQAAARAERVL